MKSKNISESIPNITIITDPIPIGNFFYSENLIKLLRFIRNMFFQPQKNFNKSKYRGHQAVTRSLIEGLKKKNLNYSYNPISKKNISKNLVVLSNVKALKQAIELKKKGIVNKIFAGPNLVVFSSDHNYILTNDAIDFVITPCNLIADLYIEDSPCLKGKIFSWPAGVDTNFWQPNKLNKNQILIFNKQTKGPVGPVEPYIKYLLEQKFNVKILNYGEFNHQKYLNELQNSIIMIGFVTDESQGIAWTEAWSCNVPTLLLRNDYNEYEGKRYKCSTAPYLCEENGLFFTDIEDFKMKLFYMIDHINKFQPRTWVLNNMSDEYCATTLYNFVNSNK
jgi:hypothetical protein